MVLIAHVRQLLKRDYRYLEVCKKLMPNHKTELEQLIDAIVSCRGPDTLNAPSDSEESEIAKPSKV